MAPDTLLTFPYARSKARYLQGPDDCSMKVCVLSEYSTKPLGRNSAGTLLSGHNNVLIETSKGRE